MPVAPDKDEKLRAWLDSSLPIIEMTGGLILRRQWVAQQYTDGMANKTAVSNDSPYSTPAQIAGVWGR